MSPVRIVVVAWTAVLFLAYLVIRGGMAANSVIDIDEFHFLHSAWMVGHGYLPYRDFWTNHSPLFIYILRPLVAYYDGNVALFPVARYLNLAVNLGLYGLVGAIAARHRPLTAGLFAALLLSVNLALFLATVRLRHDPLTLICQLIALILLARGIRSGRSREFLAAGGALGLALALSPKALFGLTGLILGYVAHQLASPGTERRPALGGFVRHMVLLLSGGLVAFGLILALILPLEVWPLMVSRVFLESFLNPERFSPLSVYLLRNMATEPVIWLVMASGYGVAAREWWVDPTRRDPLETLLLVAGLWYCVTYLILMSSPYPQSALPAIAVGSIFGGRMLAMGEARLIRAPVRKKALAWAAGLAVLVGWMVFGSARSILQEHHPFRLMNADQMQMIHYVLSVTAAEDAVFDDNAAYVFRPQASYYGSLMSTIRARIQRGQLEFDLPERCEKRSCKVVIMGSRLARLPQKVQMWIRENYVPSAFPRVLLHKSVGAEQGVPVGQGSKHAP